MSRPVHFEVQAEDAERAKAFCTAAFGWEFQDDSAMTGSAYWGITTGPKDQPGILDAGGRVALLKFRMPGMAEQGSCLDPEGNTFGLHQADPSAA